MLEARADAGEQRFTVTRESFYLLGAGYTAWQRYDHNRIDLVAEQETGNLAILREIMIQSPWEQATALVTTEREGVRTHRQFALTSTQQSIDVPIVEGDIPNVYVSVLLVNAAGRGRDRRAADGRRSRQAVVPARLCGTRRRGRDEAAHGRGGGEQGRIPAGQHRQCRVDVKDRQGRGAAAK